MTREIYCISCYARPEPAVVLDVDEDGDVRCPACVRRHGARGFPFVAVDHDHMSDPRLPPSRFSIKVSIEGA